MNRQLKDALLILDTPEVKHPEVRKLHTPDCRWAFSPKKQRDRTYRKATPHARPLQLVLTRGEVTRTLRCGHYALVVRNGWLRIPAD